MVLVAAGGLGDGVRHEQLPAPARLRLRPDEGDDPPVGAAGGAPVRPPVTAALLAANVLVFFRPGPLHRILPRINEVALNYQLFVRVCKRTYLCTAQLDEFCVRFCLPAREFHYSHHSSAVFPPVLGLVKIECFINAMQFEHWLCNPGKLK